jgi:transposase
MEIANTDLKVEEVYRQVAPLSDPWAVDRVAVDPMERRVEIWAGHPSGVTWACPECDHTGPCRDHAPERFWRHLDCAGFEVYLHARIPRVTCPRHGVRQIHIPWADPDSRFTRQFEHCALELLATCTVSGTAALLALTWDEARGIQQRAARLLAAKPLPTPQPRRRFSQRAAETSKAR